LINRKLERPTSIYPIYYDVGALDAAKYPDLMDGNF
jgi:hypothetical protein